VDQLLEIDERYLQALFELGILATTATFLFLALEYETRFPFVIGLPLVFLLLFSLSLHASSRLRERVSGNGSVTPDAIGRLGQRDDVDKLAGRMKVLRSSAWIVLLYALTQIVGFGFGSLLFLLAYYHVKTDTSYVETFVYSLLVYATIIVLFEVLLNIRLSESLLGIPPITELLFG
jgi:hypothetical protein